MNAVELLTQDHQTVATLFGQLEATKAQKEKERLFRQIKAELETHTHIEETIFYPALQQAEELNELILEAFEDHKAAKALLLEIGIQFDGSQNFDAQLNDLKQIVVRHVREEEDEVFPQVEELFVASELERLGKEMQAAKKEFQKTENVARSASS